MSTPARILRCSLYGSASRVSPAAACAAPSPRGAPPAIERWHSSEAPAFYLSTTPRPPRTSNLLSTPRKNLATLQNPSPPPKLIPDIPLFTSHPPLLSPEPGNNHNKPPDERKVKLGKTLRILQSHLPTLLQSPPPQGILSPRITLHLFPSTHPHLPTVSGRVAYTAALWSSPIAWNRLPLVGNVRLHILSERMLDCSAYDSVGGRPGGGGRRADGAGGEQLIVRWRTVGGGGRKLRGWLGFGGDESSSMGRGSGGGGGKGEGIRPREERQRERLHGEEEGGTEVKAPVGMAQAVGSSDKEFTGLFIFDFDSEGRILNHTIEHMQESGQWEKGVGAKVVGLTDWLLGGIKGGEAPCPAFAARFKKGR